MKLLIGNTGLIGTTLKDNIKFDYEFNSKNIQELSSLNIDPLNTDIYLCCLPATKWLINKDPLNDFNNMVKIVEYLSSQQYNNIILYSTIDVYQNQLDSSDENTQPPLPELNYGSIRYIFEELIKSRLKYKNILILRLPALYGKYIKKNIIYDLLNNNEINKIKYNSKFQWYNLDNLTNDTNKWIKINTNKYNCINLFPEPLETSEILKLFNIEKTKVDFNSKGIEYNCKTIYYNNGFISNKDIILKELSNFIQQNK